MFSIGEYIVYGNSGVCQVEDVCMVKAPGMVEDKMYYTLCPHYMTGSKIMTPVDNEKVVMRPVMTKKEALQLLDDLESIDFQWIEDIKKREIACKEGIRNCDTHELIRIIKMLYFRNQERLLEGKKETAGDKKYFKLAEDRLFGELAVALDMGKDEVKTWIYSWKNNYALR